MTLLTGGKAYRNGVMDDVFVLVSETSSRVLPVSDAGSDAFSDVSVHYFKECWNKDKMCRLLLLDFITHMFDTARYIYFASL